MNHTHVAMCYFPTTVVFIDDNSKFFSGLKLSLNTNHADCCFFNNGVKALEFLKTYAKKSSLTNDCILRPEERYKDERYMHIDVSTISQGIYNPDRFKETAIIVVDYAMPGLNGLEVSQKIKEMRKEYKIILLTGEADERLAIDAFNKGTIQNFINKNTKDFSKQLNKAIYQLQLAYFQDLSTIIINSLTQNPNEPPSCLNDPVFINFFNSFFERNAFTEFYLTEASGSFLFLDAEAHPTWLIVKDQELTDADIFEVEYSDFTVDSQLLEKLNNKTHLLHFNGNDALWCKPEQWKNYLFEANKIEGNETYYYALITDPTKFDIKQNKIRSYQSYLREREMINNPCAVSK